MKYYPDLKFNDSILKVTNRTRMIEYPTEARDVVLAERLGCTVETLRNLCDDLWVNTHRESVARILNIKCDRDSFSLYDMQ